MISSWGGMAPPKDPGMVKPIERVLRSGLFGPWDRPAIEGLDSLPPGINPARHHSWGIDSVTEFPLNDQEILLRHLHKVTRDLVKEHADAAR